MRTIFKNKYEQYCAKVGIPISQKMLDAAAFIETVWKSWNPRNKKNVRGVPLFCGAGKSVYICVKAYADATTEEPMVLVFASREEALEKYHILNFLRPGEVGLIIGWNYNDCKNPNKDCISPYENKRKTICSECQHRFGCNYFNSAGALSRPIVIATHDGFIWQLIKKSKGLEKFSVLIDESLKNWFQADFSFEEIRQLKCYFKDLGIESCVKMAFPMVSIDAADKIQLSPDARDAALYSMVGLQQAVKYLQKHFYENHLLWSDAENPFTNVLASV